AVIWAGAFAALLIAAQVFATIVMGSAGLNSNAGIPPRVPWADPASGVAGFAALVVLTLVARRVTPRADQPGTAPMAETARRQALVRASRIAPQRTLMAEPPVPGTVVRPRKPAPKRD